MNYFQNKTNDKSNQRAKKESQAIKLSELIESLIDVKPSTGEVFEMNKYQIMGVTRHFGCGWVSLWEITPVGCKEVGYVGMTNPTWIEVKGTCTANVPPDEIVQDALDEIKHFLNQHQ